MGFDFITKGITKQDYTPIDTNAISPDNKIVSVPKLERKGVVDTITEYGQQVSKEADSRIAKEKKAKAEKVADKVAKYKTKGLELSRPDRLDSSRVKVGNTSVELPIEDVTPDIVKKIKKVEGLSDPKNTFDYEGAVREGYKPTEILDHLKGKTSYKIDGARAEGYNDSEILNHLYSTSVGKENVPAIREQLKQSIIAEKDYGDSSDFVIGMAQSFKGATVAVTDIGNSLGLIPDSDADKHVKSLQSSITEMDKFVDNHDLLSTHTLGSIVAETAMLPVGWETIAGGALLSGLLGYAHGRQSGSIEEALVEGGVGFLVGGALSGGLHMLSHKSINKGLKELEGTLLVSPEAREGFGKFYGDWQTHTELPNKPFLLNSEPKAKALDKIQALITYASIEKPEILGKAVAGSDKVSKTVTAAIHQRKKLMGDMLKVDTGEASIKETMQAIQDGTNLVKTNYSDVIRVLGSKPVQEEAQVVLGNIRGHFNLILENAEAGNVLTEDMKLTHNIAETINDLLGRGDVGGVMESISELGKVIRRTKDANAKRKLLLFDKELRGIVRDHLTVRNYNAWKEIQTRYSDIIQFADSKIGKVVDELFLKGKKGTKTVQTNLGDTVIPNQVIKEADVTIDDLLKTLSKTNITGSELEHLATILPREKMVKFEKLLLNHTLDEGGSVTSYKALGKALEGKKLITPEGQELQKAYDALNRLHSVDDRLASTVAQLEQTAGKTEIMAILKTIMSKALVVGGISSTRIGGKLMPVLRREHLVSKYMKRTQGKFKMPKLTASGDLPIPIWEKLLSKATVELEGIMFKENEAATKIKPGLYVDNYTSNALVAKGIDPHEIVSRTVRSTILPNKIGNKLTTDSLYNHAIKKVNDDLFKKYLGKKYPTLQDNLKIRRHIDHIVESVVKGVQADTKQVRKNIIQGNIDAFIKSGKKMHATNAAKANNETTGALTRLEADNIRAGLRKSIYKALDIFESSPNLQADIKTWANKNGINHRVRTNLVKILEGGNAGDILREIQKTKLSSQRAKELLDMASKECGL